MSLILFCLLCWHLEKAKGSLTNDGCSRCASIFVNFSAVMQKLSSHSLHLIGLKMQDCHLAQFNFHPVELLKGDSNTKRLLQDGRDSHWHGKIDLSNLLLLWCQTNINMGYEHWDWWGPSYAINYNQLYPSVRQNSALAHSQMRRISGSYEINIDDAQKYSLDFWKLALTGY